MAIKYFCDHCGQPAIVRDKSIAESAYGNVGVATLRYQGIKIEVVILKEDFDKAKLSQAFVENIRTLMYGDICRRCLIQAIEEGIEKSDGN